MSLSTVLRQLILLCFQNNQKYNTVSLNTTIYIFQLIHIHHQADYKNKTVYTELPAIGTWLRIQLLKSELCYIHYMGTETKQQNIPIRIRCSQWQVRDTTMWLSRTSAASSTITANRITKHTNRDQVFAVASQRHDNVALQGRSYQLNCHHTNTHTHTHTQNMWFCCLFLS